MSLLPSGTTVAQKDEIHRLPLDLSASQCRSRCAELLSQARHRIMLGGLECLRPSPRHQAKRIFTSQRIDLTLLQDDLPAIDPTRVVLLDAPEHQDTRMRAQCVGLLMAHAGDYPVNLHNRRMALAAAKFVVDDAVKQTTNTAYLTFRGGGGA
ncbi:hypothetical protein GOALK_120_00530 [Gordonia alkanivorans NBRC 16433]|uniref:Uncharacterized protein n=1 Tax=Gordonia alkanivorans NBRC 16433 TaxID=1027371 RepID=F9W2A7_9ACTN|nr:hypothetical protein GOALK_120_00530 [Gordonia alkanivorans NBRC 16433]